MLRPFVTVVSVMVDTLRISAGLDNVTVRLVLTSCTWPSGVLVFATVSGASMPKRGSGERSVVTLSPLGPVTVTFALCVASSRVAERPEGNVVVWTTEPSGLRAMSNVVTRPIGVLAATAKPFVLSRRSKSCVAPAGSVA